MTSFLILAGAFVLAMVAVGMVRIWRRPAAADRITAPQLLGTGGIAALLLSSVATGTSALVDVALSVALLAAFASVTLVTAASQADVDPPEAAEE
jgi:multicomponent Na+:H+ antiporter subunit F